MARKRNQKSKHSTAADQTSVRAATGAATGVSPGNPPGATLLAASPLPKAASPLPEAASPLPEVDDDEIEIEVAVEEAPLSDEPMSEDVEIEAEGAEPAGRAQAVLVVQAKAQAHDPEVVSRLQALGYDLRGSVTDGVREAVDGQPLAGIYLADGAQSGQVAEFLRRALVSAGPADAGRNANDGTAGESNPARLAAADARSQMPALTEAEEVMLLDDADLEELSPGLPIGRGFSAVLVGLPLVDVLQMLNQSRRSASVTLEGCGSVHLSRGELQHAVAGARVGMDALDHLLSQPTGTVSVEAPREVETSIAGTFNSLVLGALARIDLDGAGLGGRRLESPVSEDELDAAFAPMASMEMGPSPRADRENDGSWPDLSRDDEIEWLDNHELFDDEPEEPVLPPPHRPENDLPPPSHSEPPGVVLNSESGSSNPTDDQAPHAEPRLSGLQPAESSRLAEGADAYEIEGSMVTLAEVSAEVLAPSSKSDAAEGAEDRSIEALEAHADDEDHAEDEDCADGASDGADGSLDQPGQSMEGGRRKRSKKNSGRNARKARQAAREAERAVGDDADVIVAASTGPGAVEAPGGVSAPATSDKRAIEATPASAGVGDPTAAHLAAALAAGLSGARNLLGTTNLGDAANGRSGSAGVPRVTEALASLEAPAGSIIGTVNEPAAPRIAATRTAKTGRAPDNVGAALSPPAPSTPTTPPRGTGPRRMGTLPPPSEPTEPRESERGVGLWWVAAALITIALGAAYLGSDRGTRSRNNGHQGGEHGTAISANDAPAPNPSAPATAAPYPGRNRGAEPSMGALANRTDHLKTPVRVALPLAPASVAKAPASAEHVPASLAVAHVPASLAHATAPDAVETPPARPASLAPTVAPTVAPAVAPAAVASAGVRETPSTVGASGDGLPAAPASTVPSAAPSAPATTPVREVTALAAATPPAASASSLPAPVTVAPTAVAPTAVASSSTAKARNSRRATVARLRQAAESARGTDRRADRVAAAERRAQNPQRNQSNYGARPAADRRRTANGSRPDVAALGAPTGSSGRLAVSPAVEALGGPVRAPSVQPLD